MIIVAKLGNGTKHWNWKGDRASKSAGNWRAIKLYPVLGKCQRCGLKDARERHHKDSNTLNNNPDNVMLVCHSCHGKLHPLSGESNGRAKLTAIQVCEIKVRLSMGEKQTVLAREYKVSRYPIYAIAKGLNWQSVLNKGGQENAEDKAGKKVSDRPAQGIG
jgi:hypothetical protein